MGFDVPWRRIATGGGVLILHLILVLLLLRATGLLPPIDLGNPREILLTLSPPPQPKRLEAPRPTIQEQVPVPTIPLPSVETQHTITAPPPSPDKEKQPPGDIYGLGRYLFNCSGEFFEQLSPAEKEHCLRNRWNGHKPAEKEPLLGPAAPSPFDEVIRERNAPVTPIEKQCPPDAPQSNLGLPCYDFSGHHLLEEVPGH